MKTFNKILIIVGCLICMLALTTLFIIPQRILTDAGQWMVSWGNYLGTVPPFPRIAVGIVLAVLANLLLILLIFFELKPQRKRFIRVQQVTGGVATLSNDSVVQQLHHKLDPVSGVIAVKPQIRAKGDKVQATIDVDVAAGSNVPELAGELMRVVKNVLTGDLGLQVFGEPVVRIRVTAGEAETPSQPPVEPLPVAEPEPQAPPPLPSVEEKDEDTTDREGDESAWA